MQRRITEFARRLRRKEKSTVHAAIDLVDLQNFRKGIIYVNIWQVLSDVGFDNGE